MAHSWPSSWPSAGGTRFMYSTTASESSRQPITAWPSLRPQDTLLRWQMQRLKRLATRQYFKLVSLLPLFMLLASCALFSARPVPVSCPKMPAPPPEAMVAPQYQQKLLDLFTPSTQLQRPSQKDATQTPR